MTALAIFLLNLLVWKTPAAKAQPSIFPYTSSFMRTVLDDANALAARTTLDAQRAAVFDVRDYGATGDGVTDDYAALAAAYAAAADNGTMYIPAGIFMFGTSLVWDENVSIVGAGRDTTFLTPVADQTITISGNHAVLYSDFEIDGTNQTTEVGLTIAGAARSTFQRVDIENCASDGWVFEAGAGSNNLLSMYDCKAVSNGQHGIAIQGPDVDSNNAFTLCNLDLRGNAGDGLHNDDGSGLHFVNVNASSNDLYGIRMMSSVQRCMGTVYVEGNNTPGSELDFVCEDGSHGNYIMFTNGGVNAVDESTLSLNTFVYAQAGDTTRTRMESFGVNDISLYDGTSIGPMNMSHTGDRAWKFELGAGGTGTLTLSDGSGSAFNLVVEGSITQRFGLFNNGATSSGYALFYEDSDNGSNYVKLEGPQSTGTVTATLPDYTTTLVGTGASSNPYLNTIELGHATDTTITRSRAGRLTVEGGAVAIGQVFDVRDYGAIGDDELDDTTAIQDTIDAATITGVGRGKVYIPTGTYMFSNLVLPPAITLEGETLPFSILKRITGSTGIGITDSGNAVKISLKHFTLNCNDCVGNGIELGYNTDQWGTEGVIEDILVRDIDGDAVKINANVAYIKGLNVWFPTGAGLILAGAGSHINNFECVGDATTDYGMYVSGTINTITDTHIEGIFTSPIYVTGTDNIFDNILFSITNGTTITSLIDIVGASAYGNQFKDVLTNGTTLTITNFVNDQYASTAIPYRGTTNAGGDGSYYQRSQVYDSIELSAAKTMANYQGIKTYLFDGLSANVDCKLPQVTKSYYQEIEIINSDPTWTVNIKPSASDAGTVIDGYTTQMPLPPGMSAKLRSDGVDNWHVIHGPQVSLIELGHATANTLTASGGVLSIEGVPLVTNVMTTAGDLIYGGASGAQTRLAAGATTEILVGGGAAAPVWTTATGTGAPVRGTAPQISTIELGHASDTTIARIDSGQIEIETKGLTYTATIELSSANILDLADTPITLVAAPGTDKVLEFVSAVLIHDAGTAYVEPSAPDDLVIEYSGGQDVTAAIDSTGFLTVTDDEARLVPFDVSVCPITTDLVAIKNTAFQLFNTGSDLTTGTGTMTIKVTYRVHTLGL